MSAPISSTPLEAFNYSDPSNGVLQTANQKYSAQRNNNLARAAKFVYETANRFIPGDGDTYNVGLNINVSTGLSINLTGENGSVLSDISTTDPYTTPGNAAYVRIAGTLRKITASDVLTLANGTNWFGATNPEVNNLTIQLFVYAIYNTTNNSIDISIARLPCYTKVNDRNVTQTDQRYMPLKGDTGISGTAPNPGDKCVVIGRFDARIYDNGTTKSWQALTEYRPVISNILQSEWQDMYMLANTDISVTATLNTPAGQFARQYRLDGQNCELRHMAIYTFAGTGNAQHINFPLPVPAKTVRNIMSGEINNVTARAGTYDSTSIAFIYRYDGGTFTKADCWTALSGRYRIF